MGGWHKWKITKRTNTQVVETERDKFFLMGIFTRCPQKNGEMIPILQHILNEMGGEKPDQFEQLCWDFFIFTDVLGHNFIEWFHVVQRWRKQAHREQTRKQKKTLRQIFGWFMSFLRLRHNKQPNNSVIIKKGDEPGAWWFLVAGPCETKKTPRPRW